MSVDKIHKYFISGLLFIIPIWILFVFVEGFAGMVTRMVEMNIFLAFIVALVAITLLGYAVRHIFKRYLKRGLTRGAERGGIYGFLCRTISEIDNMGDKVREAFANPILYKVDDGIYKLGFITDHDMDVLGRDNDEVLRRQGSAVQTESEAVPASDSVWVYAPYPITMTGELILVERRKISTISPEQQEAIPLFIMTAGLAEQIKQNTES